MVDFYLVPYGVSHHMQNNSHVFITVYPHIVLSVSSPFLRAGLEDYGHLTVNTDMTTIARAMAAPDSGLDIRDRMWLKITISSAFIGQSNSLEYLKSMKGNKKPVANQCNLIVIQFSGVQCPLTVIILVSYKSK